MSHLPTSFFVKVLLFWLLSSSTISSGGGTSSGGRVAAAFSHQVAVLRGPLHHRFHHTDGTRRGGSVPSNKLSLLSRQSFTTLTFTASTPTSASLTSIHHHPSLHHHDHGPTTGSSTTTSSTTSSSPSLLPPPPSSLIRRNAIIRVSIATICMFFIATFYNHRATTSPTLNVGVSLLFAAFLAAVEKSRGWIAKTRVRATEVWNTVEAHTTMAAAAAAASSTTTSTSTTSSKTTIDWDKARAGERVTLIGTAVNIGLTIFKFIAGIVGKSSAMVADAGHSLSDLASDIVTLYTVRIASLPADEDHPYGHDRFEALGSLLVAGMLTMAAVGFGTYAYESFLSLITTTTTTTTATGPAGRIALLAAFVSIVSKELLYRATAIVAQRTESQVLLANAWHHRSDAFSSIVALVSIWGATAPGGIPALDPLGGLFVAGMVGITGLRVGWSAVLQLTDTQDLELKRSIEKTVERAIVEYQLQDDLVGTPSVRTRFLGSRSWVDLTVETNPLRSASATTQVVRVLRNAILSRQPSVNDVAVVLKTHNDDENDDAEEEEEEVEGSEDEQEHDTTRTTLSTTLTTSTREGGLSKGVSQHFDTDAGYNGDDGIDATPRPLDTVALTPCQVEENVRRTLKYSRAFHHPSETTTVSSKRLKDVSNVLVHFSSLDDDEQQYCDVDIVVSADKDANLSVVEARELAETVKQDVIQHADGVADAKVSLELVA